MRSDFLGPELSRGLGVFAWDVSRVIFRVQVRVTIKFTNYEGYFKEV